MPGGGLHLDRFKLLLRSGTGMELNVAVTDERPAGSRRPRERQHHRNTSERKNCPT